MELEEGVEDGEVADVEAGAGRVEARVGHRLAAAPREPFQLQQPTPRSVKGRRWGTVKSAAARALGTVRSKTPSAKRARAVAAGLAAGSSLRTADVCCRGSSLKRNRWANRRNCRITKALAMACEGYNMVEFNLTQVGFLLACADFLAPRKISWKQF